MLWHVYKRCTAPPETFQALTEDSDHEGGLGLDREKGTIEAAGMMTRDREMVRDGNDSSGAVVGIHLNTLASIGGSQRDTVKDDAQLTNDHHSKDTENFNNSLLRASNDSADGTASDRSTTNLITNTNQHLVTSVNKTPIKAIKPPPT